MLSRLTSAIAFGVALVMSSVSHGQPTCQQCASLGVGELYSNADATVQFVMLQSKLYVDGQLVSTSPAGQTIIASDGLTEHDFTFPAIAANVAARPILLATQGFADLHLIKPDFILPSGFLFLRNGSLRLRDGPWVDRDVVRYAALPTDGRTALYLDIYEGDYTYMAIATNSAGASYRFTPNAANSFRMTAIFSDQAGLAQYIQLEEKTGMNDQHHFTGLTLEVTSRAGVYKSFTFPSDLPTADTAGRPVLLGTTHVGPPEADFALPAGFLPTDGGTLVFAGVDVWDYEYLPTNGYSLALRNGEGIGLVFRPFTGFPSRLLVWWNPVVEYYNEKLDHYFMTASQPDIDGLDTGRIFGWKRTGESFPAWIASHRPYLWEQSPPGLGPVCRLYLPQGDRSSHFFSASAAECSDALAKHPEYIEETDTAFFASLPDLQTGECGYDQIPVYRLWNARADSNHRYVTLPAIRDAMKDRGYVAEGYGPQAVAICVGGGIPAE